MADTSNFNYALFEQKELYEEGPLRDRKSDLYNLHAKDNRKLSELVRDIISLANTACEYRKYAYLLLGIAEEYRETPDGERIKEYRVVGLEQYLTHFKGNLQHNPSEVWEDVKSRLEQCIGKYIRPSVRWELKHGTLTKRDNPDEEEVVHIAYIQIAPASPKQPYAVAKQIKAGDKILRTGQSWIRRGESKREIVLQELFESQWVDIIECPFVLPRQWKQYFEKLLEQQDIRRTKRIDPYIDLHTDEDDILLDNVVEQFLSDEEVRLLVLQGGAGCGKSTFLWRLAADHAEIGAAQMDDIIRQEEFNSPPGHIPLVLSLHGSGAQVDSEQKITDRLLDKANALGTFWNERPQRPWGLFERADLSWLICLDGLDEIWDDDGQRQFLNDALKPFMDRFPRTKLILTSRPFAVEAGFREWNRTGVASIRPLTLDEISDYLAAALPREAYDDALALLESEPDLQKICSHPAHLAAAVPFFGEGYEDEPVDVLDKSSPASGLEFEEAESAPGSSTTQAIDTEEIERTEELMELASELRKELERPVQAHLSNGAKSEKHDDSQEGEGEDLRIPIPLGRALSAIYVYLWSRERERRNYGREKTDEWWETTGQFALNRDGHKPKFRKHTIDEVFGSKDPFYWLLHLAILKQIPRRLYVFFTELTQAYFAAEYIAQCIETGEDSVDSLLSSCQANFQERTRALLSDISPELL